jgi:hypothetical protein
LAINISKEEIEYSQGQVFIPTKDVKNKNISSTIGISTHLILIVLLSPNHPHEAHRVCIPDEEIPM